MKKEKKRISKMINYFYSCRIIIIIISYLRKHGMNCDNKIFNKSPLYQYFEYLSWYGNMDLESQCEKHILSKNEFFKLTQKQALIDNCRKMVYNKEKDI